MEKKVKVLMLNGSARPQGNIALAFHEMEQVFAEDGVEYENILLGRTAIRGCIELGKEQIGLPETEPRVWTNFTR